jgi:hypothetical protein
MIRFSMCAMFAAVGLLADPKIEVLKMNHAYYNENAMIKRMMVEGGVLGEKAPLVLQVSEFPVGVSLPNRPEWLKDMRENGNGSAILLWVLGQNHFQKRFYLSKDDATSFIEDKTYFKDRFRKYFQPKDLEGLQQGPIAVTAILVNGYGESIKNSRANKTVVAEYLKKSGDTKTIGDAVKSPYILFNEPYGNFQNGQPIMLDYYVFNADIGTDAFTVELYIDGKLEEVLYEWAPYKVRNLTPGVHEFKLVLIDPRKKVAPEPFGEQKNIIFVGS